MLNDPDRSRGGYPDSVKPVLDETTARRRRDESRVDGDGMGTALGVAPELRL